MNEQMRKALGFILSKGSKAYLNDICAKLNANSAERVTPNVSQQYTLFILEKLEKQKFVFLTNEESPFGHDMISATGTIKGWEEIIGEKLSPIIETVLLKLQDTAVSPGSGISNNIIVQAIKQCPEFSDVESLVEDLSGQKTDVNVALDAIFKILEYRQLILVRGDRISGRSVELLAAGRAELWKEN